VNLVLAAEAGRASGVFLIDGRIIEAPSVRPPAEVVLGSIRMEPMTRGSVSIRTLPVGGSAYPVTLVVRTRRPGESQQRLLSFREEATRLTETQTDEIPGN
jgi:hypothetical protein